MVASLHPSAVVDPAARLGAEVEIGPFCSVGADVELGAGVRLLSHTVVAGRTRIGPRTVIYPFASVGHAPQDRKYKGEASRLEIGSDVVIREHVTINPGTEGGGMLTRIGDRCLLMVGAHVAHDCQIGNDVILVNNATLAGHVEVGDFAIIGGLSAVHQFVRIGAHAMIGGMSGVERDVIPFGTVMGERASLAGLNIVGMKRRDIGRDEIHALRAVYRTLFGADEAGTLQQRAADLAARHAGTPGPVGDVLRFVTADTSRALCLPKAGSVIE